MQVTFICLNSVIIRGNNVIPYHLPLIWILWKISILFIKSNKQKLWKAVWCIVDIGMYLNKIKFFKLLTTFSCKSVNPLQCYNLKMQTTCINTNMHYKNITELYIITNTTCNIVDWLIYRGKFLTHNDMIISICQVTWTQI